MPWFLPNFGIAAPHHKHERCHKGTAINAYSVSMDDLKSLNFMLGARRHPNFLAAHVCAIGRAFHGHGLRALIAVPIRETFVNQLFLQSIMCEQMHHCLSERDLSSWDRRFESLAGTKGKRLSLIFHHLHGRELWQEIPAATPIVQRSNTSSYGHPGAAPAVCRPPKQTTGEDHRSAQPRKHDCRPRALSPPVGSPSSLSDLGSIYAGEVNSAHI
jgi:hypothetical protein